MNRETWTEKNPLKAFAGESQAQNRYTFFTDVAKKEGYDQISIFMEMAENEREHAKIFFKYLEGGDVEIVASYPAGKINSTEENLLAVAEGEKIEWGSYTQTSLKLRERKDSPKLLNHSTRSLK